MRVVETEAKTQEEAIQAALTELGLAADEVDVEVLLKEHRGGILGFMGQPVVRVRVCAKDAAGPADEPAPAEPLAEAAEVDSPAEPDLEEAPAEEVAREATPPEAAETEAPEAAAEPAPGDSADELSSPAEEGEESEDESAEESDSDEEADYSDESFDWPEEARLLVQDVLDAMGLNITAEVAEADETDIKIEAAGPDLGILIGRKGKTINSFQYLMNVILNRQSPERIRVVIDGEGYRERREQALGRMARQAADRARRSGVAVRMDPLRAFERRLVHVALQDDEAVSTHSEGEEPYRCVVVAPTEQACSLAQSRGQGEGSQRPSEAARGAAGGSGKSADGYDDFERRWIEEDEEYEYVDTDEAAENGDSDEDAATPPELPGEGPDSPGDEDREG